MCAYTQVYTNDVCIHTGVHKQCVHTHRCTQTMWAYTQEHKYMSQFDRLSPNIHDCIYTFFKSVLEKCISRECQQPSVPCLLIMFESVMIMPFVFLEKKRIRNESSWNKTIFMPFDWLFSSFFLCLEFYGYFNCTNMLFFFFWSFVHFFVCHFISFAFLKRDFGYEIFHLLGILMVCVWYT